MRRRSFQHRVCVYRISGGRLSAGTVLSRWFHLSFGRIGMDKIDPANRSRQRSCYDRRDHDKLPPVRPKSAPAMRIFFGHLRHLGHLLLHLAKGPHRLARYADGLGHTISDTDDLGIAGSGAGVGFARNARFCHSHPPPRSAKQTDQGKLCKTPWFYHLRRNDHHFLLFRRQRDHRTKFPKLFPLAIIRHPHYQRHRFICQNHHRPALISLRFNLLPINIPL